MHVLKTIWHWGVELFGGLCFEIDFLICFGMFFLNFRFHILFDYWDSSQATFRGVHNTVLGDRSEKPESNEIELYGLVLTKKQTIRLTYSALVRTTSFFMRIASASYCCCSPHLTSANIFNDSA